MAAFLVLLLSVGVLFCSSNAQENYDKLSDDYKRGVDLALENLHSRAGIQHHFLFFKTLLQSDIEPGFGVKYIYHHFYLKPTNCTKGTADSTACHFRNDRPLIDCGICYKTLGGEIEPQPKPYIHCIHKPSLTQEMKATRTQHCNRMGYSSGAPTLLASSSGAK